MTYSANTFKVKKRDYLKIGMILGIVCVGGLIFTAIIFPIFHKTVIKRNMPIVPNSMSREFFLKLPFPLEFHCHVLTIENPEEVQRGGKPALKDIGPYVFHEYIVKHDTIDDDENDTLEYTLKKTWIFKPELSKGLTGDEEITIPHPVINSLALTVNFNRRGFLKMISGVIKSMFNPTTPFWTGRAMDLLFDGVEIDCTSKSFNVKSICAIFKSGENAAVQPKPNKTGYYQFSLLGVYNDSFSGRFKVLRGKKEVRDVGRVLEVDGKDRMTTWSSDDANEYKGTDGYFTPPFQSTHEPMWAYERLICVSLGLEKERKSLIHGFRMNTFTKNLRGFAGDKAYCRKNGSCPIEGSLDLFNCMGVPIVATLPHFLDSDPSLLDNVKSGLNPKKKDHELAVTLDLETGVPIFAVKRLHFNFDIVAVPEVEVMKDMRTMLFPFAWIEERVKLPLSYAIGIHFLQFFRFLFKMLKYLCLTVVPLAAIASFATHYLIKTGQIQATDSPTSTVNVINQFERTVEKVVNKVNDITTPAPRKLATVD